MPVFVDVAASVVGKETATLLETVLINTLNDLICERTAPTRQVMVMAEASARRYGRPVADILARRERWMEDMFATITAERMRRPRGPRQPQ